MDSIQFQKLPIDIIDRIVYQIGVQHIDPKVKTLKLSPLFPPPGAFSLNNTNFSIRSYQDLINLSSTCSTLRRIIGPLIFKSVSLIRENQFDSLVESSATCRVFLDKDTSNRKFMREVLKRNFEECLRSDLAKKSFRIQVDMSNYQKFFSINNFTTNLECDNSMISTIESGIIFPNLKSLKILDSAITQREYSNKQVDQWKLLNNITYLSINCASFSNYYPIHFCIPNLKRLDILCQISQMNPINAFTCMLEDLELDTTFKLEELNIFINDHCFIKYNEFLTFLTEIFNRSPYLKHFSIRLSPRKGDDNLKSSCSWKLYDKGSNGSKFLNIINSAANLKICILDLSLLALMTLNGVENNSNNIQYHPSRELTIMLVESTMSTPVLLGNFQILLCDFLYRLGVSKLSLHYGEAKSQASIQALNLLSEIVFQMTKRTNQIQKEYNNDKFTNLKQRRGYFKRVSLQMGWSLSDDLLRREYYFGKLADQSTQSSIKYDEVTKRIINQATIWGRLHLNSPRYRICEAYEVCYNYSYPNQEPSTPITIFENELPLLNNIIINDIKLNPVSINSQDEYEDAQFWSVECSLLDLQQYVIKPRQSYLWKNM